MIDAFERWVLAVKRRQTPAARMAHDAYRTLMTLNVPDTPATRRFYGGLTALWDTTTEASEWARAKFLYEPMLRARAERVGQRLFLGSRPFVRGHARIVIGDDCSFSEFKVASGRYNDRPELLIGSRCTFGTGVFLSVNERIVIEDDVGIAGRVAISDSDGHPSDPERRRRRELMSKEDMAPVTLKEFAWIGRGAHVLKGVTIGRGAIVASGSVVATDVPDGAIAMGIPARMIKR